MSNPPRLLLDLKIALAILYSLPLPNNYYGQRPSSDQAHEYLMTLQSRNARRKILSVQQRYRDQERRQKSSINVCSSNTNASVLKFEDQQGENDNNHDIDDDNDDLIIAPKNSRIEESRKNQPLTPDLFSDDNNNNPIFIPMGSSWLASLALLCAPIENQNSLASSYTERLFAAQTLLHRIRRTKLVESIDWEMEVPYDLTNPEMCLTFLQSIVTTTTKNEITSHENSHAINLVQNYKKWIREINPFIGGIVDEFYATSSISLTSENAETIEERIKGELTVITLGAISYYTQVSSRSADLNVSLNIHNTNSIQHHHESLSIAPLISTCLSAMISVLIRLRYPPIVAREDQASTSKASNWNDRFDVPQQLVNPYTVPLVRSVQTIFDFIWKHQQQHLVLNNNVGCGIVTSNQAEHQRHYLQHHNQESLILVLHCCLGCIPDTVLGSPGGARGRFSIDPRSVQAAIQELRTIDMEILTEVLVTRLQNDQHVVSDYHNKSISLQDRLTIQTCTKWTLYVQLNPILLEMSLLRVERVLRIMSKNNVDHKIAFEFLMAMFESAAWTADQILSASIGLVSSTPQQQQQQQSLKKKQSNKSKKRQKEIVEQNATDWHIAQAKDEVYKRGANACQAMYIVWESFYPLLANAIVNNENNQVDGEGPIGCLAAGATACLPHMLRNHHSSYEYKNLFLHLTSSIQTLCSSPNKAIRVLSYEPLYSLHTSLIEVCRSTDRSNISSDMEALVIDHFFKCLMSLASSCEFPPNYFDDMTSPSDEDLEIERNDVRDILRTISDSFSSIGDATAPEQPLPICLQILSRIMDACNDSLTSAINRQQQTVSEAVAHAFSSLAKPLNNIAEFYSAKNGHPISSFERLERLLGHGLTILLNLCQTVINSFQKSQPIIQHILPLSRVVNIAVASLSPMLSFILSAPDERKLNLTSHIHSVLNAAIHCAILSLENIPELYAPSILDHSMYDIRGAMRGPGGDDHVGCLVFKRLVFESDLLATEVAKTCQPFVPRLCELLRNLKIWEDERGQGVVHGSRGVTPQSRRILISALCHLELVSRSQMGASDLLNELFTISLDMISNIGMQQPMNEYSLFRMTECTFDLASFSKPIITSLFNLDGSDSIRSRCLETLTRACVQGYQTFEISTTVEKSVVQWNRLRGALYLLLKLTANPDFPSSTCEILVACIVAECDAIQRLCSLGPTATSFIFIEDIISPENVPSGLYIKVVSDAVSSAALSPGHPKLLENCMRVLLRVVGNILSCITLSSPTPWNDKVIDPRPTVAESWFLLMNTIIENDMLSEDAVQMAILDTCVSIVSSMFNPSMAKTINERRTDPGMSLDGPHSRLALLLLEKFFRLGSQPILAAGQKLMSIIFIDLLHLQKWCSDTRLYGIAIIGAALFRANQGALPPWAVESIPEVYSALFVALNKDVAAFCTVIRLSMEIRLSSGTNRSFGMVQPGSLLSGKLFDTMSDKAKATFISDVLKVCQKDDVSSWRRMKALVKQACGGKKKETDFGQKPTFTRWEFFRI